MKKLLIALTLITSWTFANTGDTSHIITHNKVTVITNPGTGTNGYKAWGVFPSSATPVRKAYVTLSYKCPSGMACGAWDYIDQVVVRRMGGVNGTSSNTEIVRFITPYGGQFSTNWSFGWHMSRRLWFGGSHQGERRLVRDQDLWGGSRRCVLNLRHNGGSRSLGGGWPVLRHGRAARGVEGELAGIGRESRAEPNRCR